MLGSSACAPSYTHRRGQVELVHWPRVFIYPLYQNCSHRPASFREVSIDVPGRSWPTVASVSYIYYPSWPSTSRIDNESQALPIGRCASGNLGTGTTKRQVPGLSDRRLRQNLRMRKMFVPDLHTNVASTVAPSERGAAGASKIRGSYHGGQATYLSANSSWKS